MSSSVVIVANPAARGAAEKKIKAAREVLASAGLDVSVLYTKKPGDAEGLAREAASSNPRFVMAAGGDGTYNEVANGLIGTGVPMALLPLGTVNVLAREVGVPLDAEGAARAALRGRPRPVTLGKVSAQEQVRYFCLMAGVGYDGAVTAAINPLLKKLTGKGAYIVRGLGVLLGWRPGELTVTLDGEAHGAYSAIVCNAARYAGKQSVAPDARMGDPSLVAFLMHGRRRLDILRYVAGILLGRHLNYRDITYRKAERVEISGMAHMQVDGDYVGKTPAVIEAVPEALRLIY